MISHHFLNVDWSLLAQRIFTPGSAFWPALERTIGVAVFAQLIGIILGMLSALAKLSRIRTLRAISTLYVYVVRGTPQIVQIFLLYYGVGLLLGVNLFPNTANFGVFTTSGAVLAGIVGLGINEGAYMSEIIRNGINAIDKGQMESAMSVGMTRSLAMRRIILPQAARVIMPPLGNDFNTMIKQTSLLSFIGLYEIFLDAQSHYADTFRPIEDFVGVAVWYLALTTIWNLIQRQIERRLEVSDRLAVSKEARPRWRTRQVLQTQAR